MRCLRILGIVVLLVDCAGATKLLPMHCEVTDIPQEKRIELRYRNPLRETVCLTPDQWPNAAGKIDQAGDYVFVVIDGKRYPMVSFNTGYCPSCVTRVAPGEEVLASLSYDDFGIPDKLVTRPKRLVFSPVAFVCGHRRHR